MNKINVLIFQVLKFGVVGGISFIIDFIILYLLTDCFRIYYLISAALAFVIATIFNYILSILWVFEVKNEINKQRQLFIFLALSILGLCINQIIMFITVELFYIYYLAAKIFSTIAVMVWNFITRKIFLEKQ